MKDREYYFYQIITVKHWCIHHYHMEDRDISFTELSLLSIGVFHHYHKCKLKYNDLGMMHIVLVRG